MLVRYLSFGTEDQREVVDLGSNVRKRLTLFAYRMYVHGCPL